MELRDIKMSFSSAFLWLALKKAVLGLVGKFWDENETKHSHGNDFAVRVLLV